MDVFEDSDPLLDQALPQGDPVVSHGILKKALLLHPLLVIGQVGVVTNLLRDRGAHLGEELKIQVFQQLVHLLLC